MKRLLPLRTSARLQLRFSSQANLQRVHSSAQKGFAAENAGLYEKGRPEYSPETLQQIERIIRGAHGASARPLSIVELGAGTGKFTGCFMKHARKDGTLGIIDYVATEPSDGFRDVLATKGIPGVKVQSGTGDAIPAASSSVDAVVVAQAFHWMDNLATLSEVRRVLHSQGALVLVWNTYDYSYGWVREVDSSILTPAYGDDVPRQQNGRWRNCFQSVEGKKFFQPLQEWFQDVRQDGDRDMVVSRIMSTSVISERDQDYKRCVLSVLNNILDNHPELEEARRSGKFAFPYITHIAWTSPLA